VGRGKWQGRGLKEGLAAFVHHCASFPSGGAGMPVWPRAHPSMVLLLAASLQLMDTPSFYSKWIEKDLEPWKGGITRVGGGCRQRAVFQQAPTLFTCLQHDVMRRAATPGHCFFTCLAHRMAGVQPLCRLDRWWQGSVQSAQKNCIQTLHRPLPHCLLSLSAHTQDLVESAAQLYDTCDGDMVRFQILNGSLWVHHVTDR